MKKIAFYLSRILAISFVLFLGAFILEGFAPGFSWKDGLMHGLLALIVLAITIMAWAKPKIGGWIFMALGVFFYIFFHASGRSGLIIAAIPLVIGASFLIEGYGKK